MYYSFKDNVQAVAYTATAANSSAISDQTRFVRLYATTDCHINLFGTATTSKTPLAAKDYEIVKVAPGDVISVIRNASNGTLFITELTE
ncbi:hypothetical protein [uncultured Mediterranean phage uvMED]|jgi:hypothetical protein|nr:hypothetical protein [uncultured Mediterranean phage uvMED]BAR17732.1 hypothetical protein [uncultured Mediterranean phage uvMED]|tara:strand:+ start:3832 stop:4098 length:267 start_codon:yes stop_codon:yes gene_type:complete